MAAALKKLSASNLHLTFGNRGQTTVKTPFCSSLLSLIYSKAGSLQHFHCISHSQTKPRCSSCCWSTSHLCLSESEACCAIARFIYLPQTHEYLGGEFTAGIPPARCRGAAPRGAAGRRPAHPTHVPTHVPTQDRSQG